LLVAWLTCRLRGASTPRPLHTLCHVDPQKPYYHGLVSLYNAVAHTNGRHICGTAAYNDRSPTVSCFGKVHQRIWDTVLRHFRPPPTVPLNVILPRRFHTNFLYAFLISPHSCYKSNPSHSPRTVYCKPAVGRQGNALWHLRSYRSYRPYVATPCCSRCWGSCDTPRSWRTNGSTTASGASLLHPTGSSTWGTPSSPGAPAPSTLSAPRGPATVTSACQSENGCPGSSVTTNLQHFLFPSFELHV